MEKEEKELHKYILEQIKKLINDNTTINEIKQFLAQIDIIISNMSIKIFDEDFLLPFYMLLEKQKENITIGEELINYYLSNKEKLPPSLLIYFYMKQKDNMGLSNTHNKFRIGVAGIAYTDHYEDKYIGFNFGFHLQNYLTNEAYNYQCMENIIHEIIHIYQFSINPNSENIYDQLIYNDRKIWELSNETGIMNYGIMHDDYLIEHQANVWSRHFMLNFAKANLHYFNDKLISSKESEFLSKINRNSYVGGQRYAFTYLITRIFEMLPDFLENDEQREKFKEGKNKITELINKDISLRTSIKINPYIQESDRHIYLGFEPYTLDKINELMEQQHKFNK